MNKTEQSLVRNTFIIGIGSIFTKALTFLLVPLLTLWLTTVEYGDYDLYASYLSLLVPLVTLQLEQSLYRKVIENSSESKRYYTIVICFILPIIILAGCAVFLVTRFGFGAWFAPSFVAFFVSYALYNISEEYLRGLKKLGAYSLVNIVVSCLIFGFVCFFCGFLRLSITGVFLGFTIGYLIGFLAIIIVFKPFCFISSISLGDFKSDLKWMIIYCLPLLPNSIAWWFINVSDRTVIKIVLGGGNNGLYAVACKIPTLITLLFGIFNLSFQQSAIENVSSKESSAFFNTLFSRLSILLSAGVCLVVSLLPIFYTYFVSSDYYDAIYVTPILLIGTIILCLAQYLGNVLLAQKRNLAIGISTIVAAIVNLVGNIIFIPLYGLYAAASTTLVAYLIMLIYRFISLRKHFEKKGISIVAISIILACCISFLMILVFKNFDKAIFILPPIAFVMFILVNINFFKTVFFAIFSKKTKTDEYHNC